MTKLTAKTYLESKGLCDHDYMDSGMINHISEMMEEYHQHLVTLGLPSVSGCKHENETMRQGNGFTYSVCSDCGADL